MSFFLEVVQSAFSPMVLFYMFAGVAAGICIGALPGLTATMGVALLLPLTFGMDATSGILMLLGIYVGAIYGGSISAILLHTPGTPASAATAIDGYQFSKRGEAGRALGIATLSSYIGGVVSCLCLWLISPQLAKLALKFSSAEFFLLAVFGLCIIANISGENMAKGLICGFLGILTATVGIDSVTSYIRFTDNANLLSGIQYIPVMIGLFAMSQAFETIEDIYSTDEIDATVTRQRQLQQLQRQQKQRQLQQLREQLQRQQLLALTHPHGRIKQLHVSFLTMQAAVPIQLCVL